MQDNIPRHIGYILDGNRHWARAQGLKAINGHREGYQALRRIAEASFARGIEFVSAYVFSTENWRRSKLEVEAILRLFVRALGDKTVLDGQEVKVLFAGSRANVSQKLLTGMDQLEAKTRHFSGKTLVVCFNYGGQQEIVDAHKKIVQAGVDPDSLTTEEFAQYLYVPEVPPLDMIVRTGGEQRLSNFMLWRAAYSELMFYEKLWPDMMAADVDEILKEYRGRVRRFGG